MSKRDEYIAKMKAQLDAINAEIDEMERKTEHAKGEVRERYKQELAKLRQQSRDFMAKLDAVKAAGEDTWDKMTAEVDKLLAAFKHSYNYFKSQL